jgi:hypothetical protein
MVLKRRFNTDTVIIIRDHIPDDNDRDGPETSVQYRHLTRLTAREYFIEFSRRES